MRVEPFLSFDFFNLVDSNCQNLEITVTQPQFEGLAYQGKEIYEGKFTCYFTVVEENSNKINMYYRTIPRAITSDCPALYVNQFAGVLESHDGYTYHRITPPNSLIIRQQKTNLIMKGLHCHCFFPFKDQLKIRGTPMKAICRDKHLKFPKDDVISLFESSDGYHWTNKGIIVSPINNHLRDFNQTCGFDTLNVVVYDQLINKYRIFLRFNPKESYRHIQTATSDDLINWSEFKEINYRNDLYNVYVPGITNYPESPYFLGLATFQINNQHSTKYTSVMYSRNGLDWSSPNKEKPLLPDFPTPNIAANGLIIRDNKMLFYILRYHYAELSCYSVPLHRLAGIKGTGTLVSHQLNLKSSVLNLNFQTFNDGYLQVYVYSIDNKIISQTEKLTGDHLDYKWSDTSLEIECYLKFELFNCQLFAIRYDM